MTDYLESAKNALAMAIEGTKHNGSGERVYVIDAVMLAEAQALALISIAESLANASHDARAEAWAKGYAAGSKVEWTDR